MNKKLIWLAYVFFGALVITAVLKSAQQHNGDCQTCSHYLSYEKYVSK